MQDYKKELAGFLGRKSRQNNPEQLDPIKKEQGRSRTAKPLFFFCFSVRSDQSRATDTAGSRGEASQDGSTLFAFLLEQSRERGEAAEILFTGDHSHREQMQKAEANRNTAETAQEPQDGQKDKQAYFTS